MCKLSSKQVLHLNYYRFVSSRTYNVGAGECDNDDGLDFSSQNLHYHAIITNNSS